MLPVNFGILRTGMLGILMMSTLGCSSIRVETPTTYLARQDALLQMQESAPAAGYAGQSSEANKKENSLR
jgi:hypothetical protein